MAEKKGSAIPIWFSVEERKRLEEGAAIAGYKHLSTYIKDRVFARADYSLGADINGSGLSLDVDMGTRVDLLMADVAVLKAMLSFLTLASVADMSSTSKAELVRRLSSARCEGDVFSSLGDLGHTIDQLSKEMQ